MRRSGILVALVLLLAAAPMAGSDAYQQELSGALVNHIVVLRNYYESPQLTFDTSGQLVSKSSSGFGPSEGRIYVTSIKLEPEKLTLTGVRPLDVFNASAKEWQIALTATKAKVTIALPPQGDLKSAVARQLNAVFFSKAEMAGLACTPEERQKFLETPSPLRTKDKLPDVASLDQLHAYCLPGGDKAYQAGRGIKPPRAIHAPDPQYADEARNARLQGTTVLVAVVTPEGKTTAIGIQRSLGEGLDDKLHSAGYLLDQRAVEAVSQWTFHPATFQGKPVPVAIHIEVNFKLY